MLNRRRAACRATLRCSSGVVRSISFPEKGFSGGRSCSRQKARYSSTDRRISRLSSATEEP